MTRRNVQGTWTAHQANGFKIVFNVFQEANGLLNGSASTNGLHSEDCHGSVTDDSFVFVVPWNPGNSEGEYSARFNLVDRLVGFTVDLEHPQNIAGWSSDRAFPLH
jgi:hypothetical protein